MNSFKYPKMYINKCAKRVSLYLPENENLVKSRYYLLCIINKSEIDTKFKYLTYL